MIIVADCHELLYLAHTYKELRFLYFFPEEIIKMFIYMPDLGRPLTSYKYKLTVIGDILDFKLISTND